MKVIKVLLATICSLFVVFSQNVDAAKSEKLYIQDPPSSYEIGCDHDWICDGEDADCVIIFCKKCNTYDVAMKGVK